MTGWSHGYNVSTGYTYGFYRETAPDWIDLALSLRGYETPQADGERPFRYLELGSGQGLGLCMLAAANPEGEFVGIDFSPEHTAHARSLAETLGLENVRFIEGDFAALGERWAEAEGQFDYVVLHGIYSWVPGDIRRALVRILEAAVRPGGVVYVSYNAMPGWVSTLPFQHMLRLLEERGGHPGMAAIDAGRGLFLGMEEIGSAVTKALPGLKTRIESTASQPAPYLVQEYLHKNWHPLWCSEVMAEFSGAKLALAASATMAENLIPAGLPRTHQDLIGRHTDPAIREDLSDCLINQTFRRDIFGRGLRRRFVGANDWRDSYSIWRVKLEPVPSKISVATAFGKVNLDAKLYAPLFGLLGEGAKSITDIAELPIFAGDQRTLQQTLLLLVHAGWLGCGRGKKQGSEIASNRNADLARLAAVGAPYRHLIAPVLGSAVGATDSEMLMLDAYCSEPAAFDRAPAELLRKRLERLGRKLAKDGKPLSGNEETAQLQKTTSEFKSKTLPSWARLGVIDKC